MGGGGARRHRLAGGGEPRRDLARARGAAPKTALVPVAAPAAAAAAPPPVLVDGLGFAGIEPDSANAEARAWFAQGVRLIWAFDEVEAIRAFQQAQRLDPNCAMCFFGEAWARGPTINLQPRTASWRRPAPPSRRAAGSVAEPGRARPPDPARHGDPHPARRGFQQRGLCHLSWRARRCACRATTRSRSWPPTRAWSPGARPSRRSGSLAQQLLERVLARNPDHGGAIHYYIHLTDWIDRQELAVPYAERLGRIAPAASHLVHMPSHSFFGVGRYQDAAAVNVAAIAADRAFVQRARPAASDYRVGPPRAQHAFRDRKRARPRRRRHRARRVAASIRETYLQRRDRRRGSACSAPRPSMRAASTTMSRRCSLCPSPANVFDRAQRHYARGEALARRGDAAAVRAEAAAIAALRAGRDSPGLGRRGEQLAEVFQYVLEGRAAMLAGDPRAGGGRLSQGDGAPARRRFRQRSAALLVFGAAQPRRGDAGGGRCIRAPGRSSTPRCARWPNDALALYVLSRADRAAGDAATGRPQPRPGPRALGRRRHRRCRCRASKEDSPYLMRPRQGTV